MTLAERINGLDLKARTKGAVVPPGPEVAPRITKQEPPVIAPRLVDRSPFAVSEHAVEARKGFIQEQRHDADVLDAEADALHKQAAEKIRRALVLREAADHMEENPPG